MYALSSLWRAMSELNHQLWFEPLAIWARSLEDNDSATFVWQSSVCVRTVASNVILHPCTCLAFSSAVHAEWFCNTFFSTWTQRSHCSVYITFIGFGYSSPNAFSVLYSLQPTVLPRRLLQWSVCTGTLVYCCEVVQVTSYQVLKQSNMMFHKQWSEALGIDNSRMLRLIKVTFVDC